MSQDTKEKLSQSEILTMVTTEHYNLQGARSATVSEATGRASLFLSSISGTLVALGFIGQASKMGDVFYLFSLVVLPTLLFIGLVTYIRVLETSMEDFNYARAINRLRHYYLELAPELQKYFVLSTHDDVTGVMRNMAIYSPRGQTFVSTTGLIAVLNSVLSGVVVALAISAAFAAPTLVCGGAGIAIFIVVVILHEFYARRKWEEAGSNFQVLFPSEDNGSTSAEPRSPTA